MPIINQITKGGGTTPTGSISITNNGTYDVTDKATAVVNVPTTAPASYREFQLENGVLVNKKRSWIPLPAGTTDITAPYAFYYAYKSIPESILYGTIDLSMLTQISGDYVFVYCFMDSPGIQNVLFTNLTTISGIQSVVNMFSNSGIINVDFPSLTTISGVAACRDMFSSDFDKPHTITSINYPELTTISSNYAMQNCFNYQSLLTSATFPKLSSITGNYAFQTCFRNCTSLASLSFPALTSTSFGTNTTQFNNMLQDVTGCTVHFPSNLQSVIGSWADVVAGFGGTNTTVLFDLPATE